jgi:hyperosmotically inducible protein
MRQFFTNSFRRFVLTAFSLLAIFGTAGGAFAGPPRQAPARDSATYQAYLTKEVRHELTMLPFFSVFDNLEYRIDGNKVILLGQVVRPDLKDDAANAVKHIEGIQSVENDIEVLPTSPMDDQLRRAEFRAIYSYPSLQLYAVRSVPPIHIIVKNGHVTLEGSVATQADKDTANIAANTVPNVFSVTNNLHVDNGK